MIDFELLLKEANKTENCVVLGSEVLKNLDYMFFKDGIVWKIQTEITFNSKCLDIIFFLNFPSDFPYTLPKIFIDKDCYHDLKYIPHINYDFSICIFDEGLNPIIPQNNLGEVVELIICRSKKIIREAENNDYKKAEFKREFKAYWELNYSKNDIIQNLGFHSIPNQNKNEIKGIKFTNNLLSNYEYYIYNDEIELERIKKYADDNKCKYKEVGILLIENKFEVPPFELSFSETLSIIKNDNNNYLKFKELCRNNDFDSVLVIFTNENNSTVEYYGWTYKNVQILSRKQGGSRKISSKIDHLLNRVHEKKSVTRVTFDNINVDRLQIRTSSYVETQKSVAISGLGSVGSNLIFFLKNLPIDKFNLIDTDTLSTENLKRHFSGFAYLQNNKVDVIKSELKNINPLFNVDVRKKSVTSIIQNEPDFINQCDFHIVAIGKTMIEEFILKNLIEQTLVKPTLIFWVEPFLASGQMLFIMPNDAKKALELIKNYEYNVLSNVENQRDKTYLIEGSCQTGYFPYSSSYLIQFLSSIFSHLKEHITSSNNNSKIYTWIGDKDLLSKKELIITEFAQKNNSYDLIINDIC
jgi:hypothetical protein